MKALEFACPLLLRVPLKGQHSGKLSRACSIIERTRGYSVSLITGSLVLNTLKAYADVFYDHTVETHDKLYCEVHVLPG